MKRSKSRLAIASFCVLFAILGSPAQSDDVIWQTKFENADGWLIPAKSGSVQQGRLVVEAAAGAAQDLLYRGRTFEDATISIGIQIVSGAPDSAAGLHFWAKNYDDLCVVLIDASGQMQVYRWANGKRNYLAQDSAWPQLHKGIGAVNFLKVTTRGNEAAISVNDTNVLAVKGDPPPGGSEIGVRVSGAETAKTVCGFFDLKVTK